MKKARNGNIELLRFVFCVGVVLFHAWYVRRGYIGVEFFFIVTGYFLAEKICRLNARETTCPSLENAMKEATWDVLKRYRLIFPYFLVATVLGFIVRAYAQQWDSATILLNLQLIPADFLYLQNFGFSVASTTGVLWYLSAMTFAVWVLYPLLRRHYGLTVQATPAAILLILGVILQNCGSLDAPCTLLFGWVNTGMLRAFAGILGGVVANRAASTLKKIDAGKKMAAMMTAVELAGYAWVLYHIWSMNETRAMLDGIVVLALGAAFTITASGKSLFYGKFDNGFVRFLGKATMPVFLSHLYCVQFLPNILAMYSVEVTELQRLVLSFACCAIAAGIVYYVGKIIDRQMKKSWHAFCTEIIAKNK